MKFLKAVCFLILSLFIALQSPRVLSAQNVNAETLLHPPADSWPGYHGDYSGRRHSTLTQITPENAKSLRAQWVFHSTSAGTLEATPVVLNGIMYFTASNDAYALDASSLVEPLKLVKSPAELALIRRAAAIGDRAMHAAVLAIREGASEFDVAAALYHSLLSNGSDLPASPVNFMSGERTAYGHGAATERRIRRGDPMHLEYGAAYHRYTSTIGRNLSLGEPSRRHQELHNGNVSRFGRLHQRCEAARRFIGPNTKT